ncbi:cytochrome P450 [Novosphingobium sp. JCM 18896]|uniref:cytochrome P450 n=1 Tax=Novosphingobium sp. JCM 18896 TaxID=2989731 RepID=UPI0022230DA7|nr:cytochrome P450 [Novosphingobium sp. JCM 18896]MCW1430230.1 cytochrome P450 [Novosphingobium sp. JCM 18896]
MDAIVSQVERQKGEKPRSKSLDGTRGGPVRTVLPVRGYDAVRRVLRDPGLRQAGFKADLVERAGRTVRPPILFLSGEAHRRQRAATARFFTPRAVKERHRPVIEECCDRLIDQLQRRGHARLDTMALDLAVSVAAGIVGLTDSDKRGMIRRLDAFFSPALAMRHDPISGVIATVLGQLRMFHFHIRDVRPAIAARRQQPREDVISHLLSEGYSDRDILVECFTYGAAGMVTTREFVTMAGWHLLENAELRGRFLTTDRAGRLAMLEEILRLEPVVGTLYRRAKGGEPPLALDIRSANADPEAMGDDPEHLDPDRLRSDRVGGAGLAFGDGEHRCPGAGVALNEAEAFLDRLLRVPGLRLVRAPKLGWNSLVTGYELRDCRIEIV